MGVKRRKPTMEVAKHGTTFIVTTAVRALVDEGRVKPLKNAKGKPTGLYATVHPPKRRSARGAERRDGSRWTRRSYGAQRQRNRRRNAAARVARRGNRR